MKLLLDENLPKRLKNDFLWHDVYTMHELNWCGITDRELMQLLIRNKFDALLTFDKNLSYQQNFQKYSITIFVLTAINNSYRELKKLAPIILNYLNKRSLYPGPIIISLDKS